MKKLFSILLLSLYSLSMLGLWVNIHSCEGIAESINFLKEEDNCCCTTEENNMEDTCCDDETIVLQMDQEIHLSIVSSSKLILSKPIVKPALVYLKRVVEKSQNASFKYNNENIPILKRPFLINQSLILYS